MQKENESCAQFSVGITINNDKFSTSVFHKDSNIGLFTNFCSFTPMTYKKGLIKTLLSRAFKISSSWQLFHNEIENIKVLLQKNSYPPNMIDEQIKNFLDSKLKANHTNNISNDNLHYFKLPFLGNISSNTKRKITNLCKKFCKTKCIQLVFVPFKIGNLFSVKDKIPMSLRTFVVYKFTCAGCQSCYIGETKHHLTTRIKEHLESDKNSHIYQHVNQNELCKRSANVNCFEIIDDASSSFRLKLKEAFHITWKKPSLNKQVNHVSISLTI